MYQLKQLFKQQMKLTYRWYLLHNIGEFFIWAAVLIEILLLQSRANFYHVWRIILGGYAELMYPIFPQAKLLVPLGDNGYWVPSTAERYIAAHLWQPELINLLYLIARTLLTATILSGVMYLLNSYIKFLKGYIPNRCFSPFTIKNSCSARQWHTDKARAHELTWYNLPMVDSTSPQHFFIHGRNMHCEQAVDNLLQQVNPKTDPIIFYEPTSTQTNRYYRPENDIRLNLSDELLFEPHDSLAQQDKRVEIETILGWLFQPYAANEKEAINILKNYTAIKIENQHRTETIYKLASYFEPSLLEPYLIQRQSSEKLSNEIMAKTSEIAGRIRLVFEHLQKTSPKAWILAGLENSKKHRLFLGSEGEREDVAWLFGIIWLNMIARHLCERNEIPGTQTWLVINNTRALAHSQPLIKLIRQQQKPSLHIIITQAFITKPTQNFNPDKALYDLLPEIKNQLYCGNDDTKTAAETASLMNHCFNTLYPHQRNIITREDILSLSSWQAYLFQKPWRITRIKIPEMKDTNQEKNTGTHNSLMSFRQFLVEKVK